MPPTATTAHETPGPTSTVSNNVAGAAVKSYALSVRARPIERRSVPRRAKESVSVDALATMMERVLGEDAGMRRTRGRRRRSEVVARASKTGALGAFGATPMVWPREQRDEGEEPSSRGNADGEKAAVLLDKLEEEEAADELCFLIDKCELDSEGKQAMFMPYIT